VSLSDFRRLAGLTDVRTLDEGLKGAEAETHLRNLLRTWDPAGGTTAEVAKKAGLSVAVTLRLLNKIHDEGFKSDDGSSLSRGEGEAGKNRGIQSGNEKQPKRFIWMFM